jgi:hypothetical protein
VPPPQELSVAAQPSQLLTHPPVGLFSWRPKSPTTTPPPPATLGVVVGLRLDGVKNAKDNGEYPVGSRGTRQ